MQIYLLFQTKPTFTVLIALTSYNVKTIAIDTQTNAGVHFNLKRPTLFYTCSYSGSTTHGELLILTTAGLSNYQI